MTELTAVLTANDLDGIIATIARKISADYQHRELVLVGVLKGAFIFMADLVRKLTVSPHIAFISASSYGDATTSSGRLHLSGALGPDVAGKDVLIVEDIIDTGLTLSRLVQHMKDAGAASVRICTLIDKRERRRTDVQVHYAGQVVESGFLVGFGLDYAEQYRHLPGIFQLNLSQ